MAKMKQVFKVEKGGNHHKPFTLNQIKPGTISVIENIRTVKKHGSS